MSRSVARLLHGLTRTITAPQSPRRRAMTLSRLMERLDGESAHVIETKYGPIKAQLPTAGLVLLVNIGVMYVVAC